MTWLWNWLASLPGRIASQVRASFWALLSLNSDQQRALMAWGMLGAMVALSFGVWHGADFLEGIYAASSEAIKQAIVTIFGDTIKLLILLVGLMAGGVVLIARGGEMTIKLPGGAELSARGTAAAGELAKSVDVAAVTAAEPK